jgi:hypothetical protein
LIQNLSLNSTLIITVFFPTETCKKLPFLTFQNLIMVSQKTSSTKQKCQAAFCPSPQIAIFRFHSFQTGPFQLINQQLINLLFARKTFYISWRQLSIKFSKSEAVTFDKISYQPLGDAPGVFHCAQICPVLCTTVSLTYTYPLRLELDFRRAAVQPPSQGMPRQ